MSLNEILDQRIQEQGRHPNEVRRSLMTNLNYGKSESELIKKLNGRNPTELKHKGIITGSTSQVIDQLHQYNELGLNEIMLQWIDL